MFSRQDRAEGYISYGNSIITSPWGEVLAKMDEKEGMLIQDIDSWSVWMKCGSSFR
ncbi:MAG: nitrilase-related carbon-nitrogen hydrolase [Enterocloster sp.]